MVYSCGRLPPSCPAGLWWLFAYSVLTHEEIVDLLWSDELRLLFPQRFPSLTEDQPEEAHVYAFGSAVIQDLG